LDRALLLVGGLGTRLKSETGILPKAMIDIGGKPFLERLLLHLKSFQIESFVLAVSHGRERIEDYFGSGRGLKLSIEYSDEKELLGTAGALRQAFPLIQQDHILVLNGDSFLDVDYHAMFALHLEHENKVTLAAVRQPDCRDFGRLEVKDDTVHRFAEKNRNDASPGYINAGVYIFERSLITTIPQGIAQSLEKDTFPSILSQGGKIGAYRVHGYFADLGTPERLQKFRGDFSREAVPLLGGKSGSMDSHV
jgi:mannose-1-phosphate guanylyltransferase